MQTSGDEILQELGAKANRLASWKFPFLAAALLENYDGDQAAETKTARLEQARAFQELARERDQGKP